MSRNALCFGLFIALLRALTTRTASLQQFVVVKIIQREQDTRVEAIGGKVRIGEEFSAGQEVLKDWFYTCAFFGTLLFATFYYSLGLLLGFAREAIKECQHRRAGLDEPTCELELDRDDDLDSLMREEPQTTDEEDFFDETAETDETETIGGEESNDGFANSHAPEYYDSAVRSPRIRVVERHNDVDAWEDLHPADFHSNVSSASPSPTYVSEPSPNVRSTSQGRRQVSDAELSDLISMGPLETVGNENNSFKDSDSRHSHPFFFFFVCW